MPDCFDCLIYWGHIFEERGSHTGCSCIWEYPELWVALRELMYFSEGRCIPNYVFIHHSRHFTHQIAIDSVLSDLGLQTGKRCSEEVLFFNILGTSAHLPQKYIPFFVVKSFGMQMYLVSGIFWVWWNWKWIETVIEIGLSGLIPMDLEAWIDLYFFKLYTVVIYHYMLVTAQLYRNIWMLFWRYERQRPKLKFQILLKVMEITQDFSVLSPGSDLRSGNGW